MNYLHIKTNQTYRVLFEAFDVQTQRPAIVYMNTEGQMFVRDHELFNRHFSYINDPQADIQPKGEKPPLSAQLELFNDERERSREISQAES